jgi:hypothetical protein
MLHLGWLHLYTHILGNAEKVCWENILSYSTVLSLTTQKSFMRLTPLHLQQLLARKPIINSGARLLKNKRLVNIKITSNLHL